MTYAYTATERKRVSFGKIPEAMELPNLISVQRESFERFKDEGLREAFKESSPIQSQNHVLEVTFGEHQFGDPAHTVEECREKDMTYQAPLLTDVRLTNKETGEIKEQLVFMGDFPMMTDQGTFIINGTERIVVSQLVRSPGVYYSSEMDSGKQIYKAQIIPSRGAWLEFEVDKRDQLMVSIDRKRKQSATMFLRALGIAVTNDDIIELLGNSDVIKRTLERDTALTREDALIEIYRRLRPGEPPTVDASRSLLEGLLFNPQRYDLARVGRYKVNKKLNLTTEEEVTVLTDEDIVATLRYLLSLAAGEQGFKVDDIDHFGNRRIRTVGELVANQFRIGMSRMERVVRERMSSQDIDEITPQSLINIRPIVASIKEFFGSSQLSQFMDQANPLTGLTHKRRLSALGPGGLAGHKSGSSRRTNVPTAVRDVHNSHYSRMCPIETPEGPNIGLIGSLALYARVNEYGFIEAPFRRVENGVATDQIDWMTADEEEKHVIAPANTPLDPKTNEFITTDAEGKIVRPHTVIARTRDFDGSFGAPADVPVEDVDYMDVSPRQMLSVAATLIPFLEHDDAKRTLMGANMQRQAVPLVHPAAPYVGTGMERRAALDSGEVTLAKNAGEVIFADAAKIIVKHAGGMDEYHLAKYQRSNQSTCINHRPLVRVGDTVEQGEPLADGPSTDHGELALGQNLTVAYMPWEGFNYEDGIVVSERLVAEGYDLEKIGSAIVEDYSTQVLDDGFFHADPHAGNIILKDGIVYFIDLGMVGRMSSHDRGIVKDMIFAVAEGDVPKLKDSLMRFAVTRGDSAELDHSAFLSDLDFIVADFAGLDLKDLDIGEFLTSLLNLARKNDVELPSVVTMFARGMVTLEGLLTEYMPNVNMIQIIQTHIKNEKSTYARVREMGRDLAASSYRAAKGSLEAAEYLGLASRMLTRGQLKVNTQIMSSDKALRQLGGIIDRMSMAIVIAGLFIGSSVVYYARIEPVVFGIPVIGFMGYVSALVLALMLGREIWRNSHGGKH